MNEVSTTLTAILQRGSCSSKRLGIPPRSTQLVSGGPPTPLSKELREKKALSSGGKSTYPLSPPQRGKHKDRAKKGTLLQ